MSEWEGYFRGVMQLPSQIEKDALLYSSSVIAYDEKYRMLSESEIETINMPPEERAPLMLNDEKFIRVGPHLEFDGWSLLLYKKIGGEESAREKITLFVARMNELVWIGQFRDENQPVVVRHIEDKMKDLFNYFLGDQ